MNLFLNDVQKFKNIKNENCARYTFFSENTFISRQSLANFLSLNVFVN